MSKKKSDLDTRSRRELAGKSVTPAVDRPDWLPDDWTMEVKKRGKSSSDGRRVDRVDRYYICPLSGKRLRSRLEVMRVLNNKNLGHSESDSAPHDGGYKQQQPPVESKRSEVKRTMARRHLFERKGPISDAITEIKLADSPQERASSSLTDALPQLDNGASETSCLTPKNAEHSDQRISESQIEREPNPTVHIEEQPTINVLPAPGNEKLSEPLLLLEGVIPVPDANLSEEAQKRHGSSNTEANRHGPRKKSTEKRESIPTRTSKRLAGVTADPVSDFGSVKKLKCPRTAQIEPAPPIVPEAHEKDASVTVEEEEAKGLNSFEEASRKQAADELQPIVPVDACPSSHQIDTPKEKLEPAEPFVGQASQKQQKPNDLPTNSLSFGNSWSDPCIEFAFKTLTSDFSVLEEILAMQDYFVGPSASAFGGPSFFRDDGGRPCPLEKGNPELSNPPSKKTM